ncbi:GNAT family N-acetyltransferase [Rhizobium straminoryzae]|uniref:GNAT family N-acetyltransferase n=1 Tax=Rhizobium straminoryzae TaxID=1387186 RepID=A0A549TE91_9HYPH|nr:GNAT family N-acetyltransferase [Rhizobium straminoryzae]TRL40508.1 GNAT family N-acetyltransferase [Rhizobium straminoryzae]
MNAGSADIRRILADEVEAFRRIRLEALHNEPSSFASSYDDWVSLSTDEWKQRLRDPVFIAFQGSEPVGIVGLRPQRARKMAHRATIIMVYVRNDQRGSGLAHKLLHAVADHARGMGISQLELAVSGDNIPAIRFYSREGFLEVGRIPCGFIHDGKEIDDVLMMCRLPV